MGLVLAVVGMVCAYMFGRSHVTGREAELVEEQKEFDAWMFMNVTRIALISLVRGDKPPQLAERLNKFTQDNQLVWVPTVEVSQTDEHHDVEERGE